MKTVNLSDYECAVLLGLLEDHISEYGNKDWKLEVRLALKSVIKKLGGSDELLEYVGGII